MMGAIEALHIVDERNNPILSHTYAARPPSIAHLLPLYLEHPSPRSNPIYLTNTNPPTLVFSLHHANLLFLLTTSSEVEPLLVLEFLHRVIDALEDFLGAPLISHKIENNYDVVAQILTEMCDAGTVATTEPNALRDNVEVEGWMGKLLGSITLPNQVKELGASALGRAPSPAMGAGIHSSMLAISSSAKSQSAAAALPWRRSNVRHTSNEMYADVVESLNVILAPSGRPLVAFANGTIAFTSKVSGLPDITVTMSGPSGKHDLGNVLELPVFHPCVRLARWKQQPGLLSFIPPDGRFVLAGYEVNLLPFPESTGAITGASSLKLPVDIEVRTGLGTSGTEFEVRVHVNKFFGASSGAVGNGSGVRSAGGSGRGHAGTPSSPLLEDLTLDVPFPVEVRNLPELRASKGDATFNMADKQLRWHIPTKEYRDGSSDFYLKGSVASLQTTHRDDVNDGPFDGSEAIAYDEPYQADAAVARLGNAAINETNPAVSDADTKRIAQNKVLMPTSVSMSFSVKGWLASGLKIDSIVLDTHQSRGLGDGVKPYKGVKYLTVSKQGVEIRC